LDGKIATIVASYNHAREARQRLGYTDSNYHPINKSDLQMPADITEANRIGQKSYKLPWFWRIGDQDGDESSEYMKDCGCISDCSTQLIIIVSIVYRVNWLRNSARYHRWNEQVIQLHHEMKWTINYFKFHKGKWENWTMEQEMDGDESLYKQGLRSYASKQAQTWARLESRAHNLFDSILGDDL
jgi:hypothetical protein